MTYEHPEHPQWHVTCKKLKLYIVLAQELEHKSYWKNAWDKDKNNTCMYIILVLHPHQLNHLCVDISISLDTDQMLEMYRYGC